MTTPRELFHQVMRFECPGRTLLTLGGIWQSAFERWEQEGMPKELGSGPALTEHFGLSPHTWTKPKANIFVYPEFERKVVRETDRTVTYVNPMGIVCTDLRKDAYKSMPHFEEYPVKTRADWEAYRERLLWGPDRIGDPWEEQKQELAASDLPVILALNRGASLYGVLREMMGVEAISLLFYDDPGMVVEMMDTMVELCLNSIEALFTDYVPDAVCLWEDMAYKTGSLLGVQHVRELMVPRYQKITSLLRDKGVPYIFLDSDGYIAELIPLWLEGGIDGVVPMEGQCGMDVWVYREQYPELLMIGGVNKAELAKGRTAVDREIEKVRKTVGTGGYIPFFDHGLPHDVSWDSFVYFVERLKEING